MRPYTKQNGVVVLPTKGKELHFIPDINPHKIVIQVHGPKGALHGTARPDLSDLREALLMAGVGTRRE
jgi:hypothetical protein